jgi:phosphatidylserine/phosphatidylglycerophosphate/cardiolipin synthase-like enzyme
MSTGSINLDILLNQIREDAIARTNEAVAEIKRRYPKLSDKEAQEIHALVVAAASEADKPKASLVVTAPPSFAIRASSTKITVDSMISNAKSSILITGYSLSDYFGDMIDCLIRKSQSGVFVKFYVNHIENQASFDKLCRYKGRFLKIYNYPKQDDKMSALHAKVISVDQEETLITSANLSYHGQEGNIELGTHIISPEIARQVEDVFTRLLFSKVFQEV